MRMGSALRKVVPQSGPAPWGQKQRVAGPEAWGAPWPTPQVYTVMCVCMGLTVGAQGPAAISLAKQCGRVRGR